MAEASTLAFCVPEDALAATATADVGDRASGVHDGANRTRGGG